MKKILKISNRGADGMGRRVAEAVLTLFIIVIFCLFAIQVTSLTHEEMSHVSTIYKQEDSGRNNRMLLMRAGTDLERALLNYYLGRETVDIDDITQFREYFFNMLDSLVHAEAPDDDLIQLYHRVHDGVKRMESYESAPVPLSVEKISSFSSDLMLWQDDFRDLRQYLQKNSARARPIYSEPSQRFLISSIGSMAVSGLGLIILLLLKLRVTEKLLRDRQKLSGLLEPRIAAIETAMDGVAITDQRGMMRYVNAALAGYHGYDSADLLIGRPWRSLYDAEQQDWFVNEVIPHIEHEGRWRGHCKGLRRDGSHFHEDVVIVAMDDGGYVFVVRDYTELLDSIVLSNKRLAAIEAAGDGIGIIDSNGMLVYANRAMRVLHGLSEDEFDQYMNKDWSLIYTDKGRENIRDVVMPELRKNGYWQGESPLVKKNGDIIFAELTLTLLPDGGFIGTARDISERKRAEQENDKLQRQFFQAQKMEALGRMAGGIAHDFNNILSSIIGYAEFLIDDLPPDTPQNGFARQIFKGGDQARKLVEQILAFSRRSDVGMTVMDMSSAIQDCREMLKPSMPANIRLDVYMDGAERNINANPTQISQALMNLCVNAIDAMEDAPSANLRIESHTEIANEDTVPIGMLSEHLPKPEQEAAVNIVSSGDALVLMSGHLQNLNRYVVVRVSDTGTGMPREVMEHIFEPFFTTKAVDRGTGLGLAAVHGIVTSHRGAIIVESREGKGTAFTLYFPQTDNAAEDALPKFQPRAAAEEARILVVDDQPDVAVIAVEMLSRLGYQVESVDDGHAAIDMLRENPGHFDLVLSDFSMPEMTGAELAEQVVQDFPNLPVVIMTGHGRKTLEKALKQNPAIVAMVRKPLDRAVLSQVIGRILKRSQAA